jgi:hypothetical protein
MMRMRGCWLCAADGRPAGRGLPQRRAPPQAAPSRATAEFDNDDKQLCNSPQHARSSPGAAHVPSLCALRRYAAARRRGGAARAVRLRCARDTELATCPHATAHRHFFAERGVGTRAAHAVTSPDRAWQELVATRGRKAADDDRCCVVAAIRLLHHGGASCTSSGTRRARAPDVTPRRCVCGRACARRKPQASTRR